MHWDNAVSHQATGFKGSRRACDRIYRGKLQYSELLRPLTYYFTMEVDSCEITTLPMFAGSVASGIRTSKSDEFFASFVSKKRHIPLHMVQEFLDLIRHPEFNLEELSLTRAEETLSYGPSLRRQLTYAQGDLNAMDARPLTPPSEIQAKSIMHILPEDVLDVIASHLARSRPSFATLATAQERAASTSQGRYVLHKPCSCLRTLMHMSLVCRAWTQTAQRYLRRVARAVGATGLRSILAGAPAAIAAIRELHVILPPSLYSVGEQPAEDLREALFLLRVLLGKTRSLEGLYFQTSTKAFSDNALPFVGQSLAEIFEELGKHNALKCLWLTHITCPITPARVCEAAKHLEKLYVVLPRMHALRQIWIHNWCEGQLHRAVYPHMIRPARPTSIVNTTDVHADSDELATTIEELSYRLGAGGVTFAEVLQLGAAAHLMPVARPLTTLFTRAALNVSRLRLLASNLFVQGIRTPSSLLVALSPPPPRLESLELTLDSEAETDLDPRELSSRLLAPHAVPNLRELTLILSSPRTSSVPQLVLPPQLRVLHVHCAKSALGRTCLRSLNTAIEGETWWSTIDTSLNYLLRIWENEGMHEAKGPKRRLEEVRLTIDLTSAMQNEVEKGFRSDEGRWELEGPCLVPKLKDFCDMHGVAFCCYRVAFPL